MMLKHLVHQTADYHKSMLRLVRWMCVCLSAAVYLHSVCVFVCACAVWAEIKEMGLLFFLLYCVNNCPKIGRMNHSVC